MEGCEIFIYHGKRLETGLESIRRQYIAAAVCKSISGLAVMNKETSHGLIAADRNHTSAGWSCSGEFQLRSPDCDGVPVLD